MGCQLVTSIATCVRCWNAHSYAGRRSTISITMEIHLHCAEEVEDGRE